MQQRVNPAVVGVAVVILIAFCVFMLMRANNSQSPRQLPPTGDTYKPGYSSPTFNMRHKAGNAPNTQGGTQ